MKVLQAVDFHLQYHQANSKKNTLKTCEFVLSRFKAQFGKRDLARTLDLQQQRPQHKQTYFC